MESAPPNDLDDFAHPGTLLKRDVLPGLGLSVTQAAADLQVTRQTLHRILAGSAAITPEMALRLERLTGVAAMIWLELQESYDLHRVKVLQPFDMSGIPSHGLPTALAAIVKRHVMTIRKNKVRYPSRRSNASALP